MSSFTFNQNLQKPSSGAMKPQQFNPHPHPGMSVTQPHLSTHVSRVMSPSRVNRPCSPARRQEAKEETVPKWKAASLRGRGSGLSSTMSRIPKVPTAKGKENLRGRGGGIGRARIAKPVISVARSRIAKKQKELDEAQELLIDYAKDQSLTDSLPRPKAISVPKPKSPIVSKLVPDLHEVILKKIKINKRRSIQRQSFQTNQSPCKAPAPCEDLLAQERVNQSHNDSVNSSVNLDRDSPVSGQDLETYLSSVFNLVDTYRSGVARARSLFEFISNLVDLPKLDKWKLEELNRLLDPNNDNRYVDMDTWSQVGKSWVDMMMNPDYHSMSSSDRSSEACDMEDVDDIVNADNDNFVDVFETAQGCEVPSFCHELCTDQEEALTNISFGSIEGYGAGDDMAATARELELEARIEELNHQLCKLKEENREMQKNLVASEEFGLSLTTELEDSQRRLSLSSSVLTKDKVPDSSVSAKEWEQQCSRLQRKLAILEDDINIRDSKLEDMEVQVVTLKAEVCELKDKEEEALGLVDDLKAKYSNMEMILSVKEEEITREIVARELVEEKLEETRSKVNKLEQDLSMKDEEIRNLTETTGGGGASRLGSVGSNANNSFSTIHDVSVDEKMIEENLKMIVTPGKMSINPSVLSKIKGPSASSTPNKGSLGSIADELSNIQTPGSSMPSPFCEKTETKIEVYLDRLVDKARKAIGAQLEPAKKKVFMSFMNKETMELKKIIEEFMYDLPTTEEFLALKEANKDLEERLNVANTAIENFQYKVDKNDFVCEEEEDTAEDYVGNVSVKIDAVTSILKAANSVLLAQTHSEETTDFSLDPEMDVSGWQLDLEGIQLGSWQQRLVSNLSKKRLSGQGNRSAFPTELSRSPVPGASKLWQSLYKRLDDLHKVSETSCDLIKMTEASFREHSQLQLSAHLHTTKSKAITELVSVSCQTEVEIQVPKPTSSIMIQTEDEDAASHKECKRENCFCPKSQIRDSKRASKWRSLFRGVFYMVLLVLSFTFLCGLEIDGDVYYPVSWYSLRAGLGDIVPDPVIAVSYQTGCRRHL